MESSALKHEIQGAQHNYGLYEKTKSKSKAPGATGRYQTTALGREYKNDLICAEKQFLEPKKFTQKEI